MSKRQISFDDQVNNWVLFNGCLFDKVEWLSARVLKVNKGLFESYKLLRNLLWNIENLMSNFDWKFSTSSSEDSREFTKTTKW